MEGRPKYGGLPSAISIAVIPNDHISALSFGTPDENNSGAMNNGVPCPSFVLMVYPDDLAETPKSAVIKDLCECVIFLCFFSNRYPV